MEVAMELWEEIEEYLLAYQTISQLSKVSRTVVLNLLRLLPFDTVLHVVMIPSHKIILLLLHNCNFATVRNHNVNI